ncbi:YceI family protein [Polaribacter pectinis]|uniref:YceI family protein n=1 Tax=Polaribacter pectinis TaxID=2738844 RepID=A0A7G9L689_9FLAO|nr:YceI family protein [Polaribacter pectinis]QNM84138.1 YceI family protein [Polaribacter pectinis]
MKKTYTVLFVAMLVFNFTACKSESKKENTNEVTTVTKKSNATFSLKKATNEVNFTAYKTTDKVAVGGQFKEVNILSGGEGNSIKEAINNTEFSIPVSSIFTKDSSRDYKIQKFFFGVMDKTKLLSGKLLIENDSIGSATIIMNGVSEKVPFTYTIKDKTFSMEATMDVNKWNAAAALASLNKICEALHTGSDGISRTWNDVALNISSTF